MAEPNLNWIDTPEFHWNPERPFRAEPQFAAAVEPADEQDFEPAFSAAFEPSFEPSFEATPANDDTAITPEPAPVAEPVIKARTPDYFLSRLLIGLAQGFGLIFLFAAPNTLTSPLGMVLLFAPLMLLAGLGSIPGKLLLPWTLIASLGLAFVGSLQTPDTTNFLLVAVAGGFLFVGQALVMAWGKSAAPLAPYSAYHDAGWTLGLQCLAGLGAALACAILVNDSFDLMRLTYPVARPVFLIALLAPLAVALASWLASPQRLTVLQEFVTRFLILMLAPMVLLGAAIDVAGLLLQWQPPLLVCLAQAFALLLCVNASYGTGTPRSRAREILEAATPFVLVPLVLLGAAALGSGVALGWTAPRILAAAVLAMLAGYALFYALSALIGLGGGGWMKRIERANLGLALVALALLGTLACR